MFDEKHSNIFFAFVPFSIPGIEIYQLLQLCTARTGFPILVTVRLYTVMPEVCRWLTIEKQRKTDIRLTHQ